MPKYSWETPESRAEAARLRPYWFRAKDELGLTQVKVAEIMGVTQSSVARWLSGLQPIPQERLIELAALLKFDPIEIRPELARFVRPVRDMTISEDAFLLAQVFDSLDETSRSAVEKLMLVLSDASKSRLPPEK